MNTTLILRRLPHILWLLVVWIALWGDLSVANILSGSIVVGIFAWVFTDVGPRPASPFRPRHAAKLLGWFARSLLQSTWEVARRVLGSDPVKPAIIAFPMRHVADSVVTLVADIITLTPGTLTLDIRSDGDDAILYVHVLDLDDELASRAELEELRRLAILAFGDAEALAYLEETA